MTIIRHWFVIPHFEDEYASFAARVLHYALLTLLCIALIFLFFASSLSQLLFIPVLFLILGGCYDLLHRGYLRLSGGIFITGIWLIITVASFSINGIRNASISTYAVVIIFAAIIFQNRAVTVFTVLSVLSATLLTVGETLAVLPLRTTPLFLADRFFQQVALFSTTGILLFAASRVIRTSFERIRNNEATLCERNKELELEVVERRRIEAELRVSEEKYRLLFENISTLVAVYDQHGEIILVNQATAQLLNTTVEALQGRKMHDMFPPEYVENSMEQNLQVIQTGKDSLIESQLTLPNGREFYYLRHVMPIPTSDSDSPYQVMVVTTDLTERNIAQRREQELMLAQEKNAFLTEFFSTLSHDLKTPLAVMNTSLYLLERAESISQRQEKIKRIGEQVMLMDKFIQDMLTISRLEYLPLVNFESLDLNRLIDGIIEQLRPRIESKELAFDFDAEPGLPAIQGDQEQIQRMLTNLIENAINYTPAKGRVALRTTSEGGWVAFEVRDSGIGIDPDSMPLIFERFFRTTKAREFTASGTGLGLAIVKKIAEVHTATIDVRSIVGEGTTFQIQFAKELIS